jgi:hypothetical protein
VIISCEMKKKRILFITTKYNEYTWTFKMIWLVDFNGSERAINDQIKISVSQPSSPKYIRLHTHSWGMSKVTQINFSRNATWDECQDTENRIPARHPLMYSCLMLWNYLIQECSVLFTVFVEVIGIVCSCCWRLIRENNFGFEAQLCMHTEQGPI